MGKAEFRGLQNLCIPEDLPKRTHLLLNLMVSFHRTLFFRDETILCFINERNVQGCRDGVPVTSCVFVKSSCRTLVEL